MAGKPKSRQEEALQFLDDLDNMAPPPEASSAQPGSLSPAVPPPAGEAEVYAFIDEITQKSSEPPRTALSHIDRPLSRAGTPTLRKSTERVRVGAPTPLLPSSGSASPIVRSESSSSRVSMSPAPRTEARQEPGSAPPAGQAGGWGWGSVWSSASAALQQARSVVDEQVKNLPKNEQARKWGEGVLEYAKAAQLDKLGQSSL